VMWREAPERSVALNLLVSLRPSQWAKNLLVFAGVLFGLRLFDVTAVARASAAFVIFCLLSGVVYLINDIADRHSDRQHPLKARRPIASGALPVATALTSAIVLGGFALAGAFALGRTFFVVAAGYLALLALYSGPLKHIVIIDVLTIAIGFVLRAVAGAVAVDVSISQWLLVCTILLALFISLAKRRHELVLLADGAVSHRPILGEYSPYLLDQMIAVVTASTLIAYIFYTISPETAQKFGTQWLGLTVPFPLYGIFRYLYLVHRREGGGSPADLLLTDRPLLLCVTLWAVSVALIIYQPL
jgi:4-hydroxybenzoate polyprenyltransferase